MSGIPQSRKLRITPLSPVHMGTDEDYTPTGYVIDGNALFEFDQRALENLPESERRALDRMLDGKAEPRMLKNVQAFFHKNREWLIPSAVNVVPVSEEMARLYKDRIGKAANIESSGKQVINALEIERAAYNPADRRLMFPGTGLKGAMRTALLDAVNQGRRAEQGERNRDIQQRLFQYTMRDLHKDPMRLVQVGDCHWQGSAELNSAEVLFAVNRKKQPVVKNGREVTSQAEQRNLYQLLECASPFRFRAFEGLLTIPDVSGLQRGDNKLPSKKFSFGEIATACNRFYRPIFEAETEMLRSRGFLDDKWWQTVQALLSDSAIQKRLEQNDAFLLRVGRHSGAESVTLNGVRSIKIMKGKGQKPGWEPEAKTVWLATGDKQDKRYLRPFGWLLVEMTELDEELPAWPEAEAIINAHTEKMRNWLEGIEQRKKSLGEKVAKAMEAARQQAEEEKARKEQEEEEAKRLAAMSEEEKMMEELRRQLEQDQQAGRKEPGGVLNEKRLALLQKAEEWSDPVLRKQAAGLIRETAKHLPWAKKRKKEMAARLDALGSQP